tara:strand:+ start:355 stop:4734 length:4380 start_codon:yes stop_codon:yes gene_type:complete
VECIKNIDCVGNWSQCTTNCEEAEDRVWITETPPSGEGSLCPTTPSVDCEQGDGDCGKRESCENYNCEDRQRYEHWDNELDKWSTYSSKWDYPTSTPTCNDIECVEQQEGTTKEAVSTYYADLDACCIKDYDCVQDPLLPCSQSCETGIQRIPRVIRKNSGKGEECPHLSPPTCSPGDGDCPRDCDGTWGNCTEDCERIWTEIKAQSGTGKACPSAPTCSPGEDYCPRNCEGKWSACSTTCTSIWEQTQAHHGTGSPCPNDIIECPPGKDECPPNIDCFGVWSDCNDVCFKEYTILTPNEGNGLPCPIPVAGDNSVYPERLSQFVKSGSQREPMYGVALCEGQIGDIDCSREFSKLPINEQDRNACYNINVSCNYSGKLGRICENDECVEDNSKTSSDYTRIFAESEILDTKDDEVLHNILEGQGVNTSEVVGWRRVFYANNYETIHTIEQRLGNALPTDMEGLGVNSLTPGPWSNWKVDGEVRNGMTPLELSGLMYQPYHFHKACDKYSTTLVLGKNRSAGRLEREMQAMEEEKESLSQQIRILTTQRNAIFATQYGDWDLSRKDLPEPVQRKDDEIDALRDEQVVLIESLEELKVTLEDKNHYDGRLHRTGSLGRVLEVSTLPPRRGGEYIFGGYTNTSWAVTPFEYKLNSDELNYTDNEMKLAEVNSISSESSAHQDYANKTYLDTTTLTNFNNLLDTPATCVKKSPSYDLSSSTLGRNPRHQESDWRLSVGSGQFMRTLQKDARLNDAGGLQDAPELPDHCTTASIDSHWGSDYSFNKGKESVDQCSPDCNWVPWNNVWNGQFIFRIRGPSRGPIVFEANPNFKRESLNKPLTCIGSTSNINHNSVECTQDGCTFHWDTDMWSDLAGWGAADVHNLPDTELPTGGGGVRRSNYGTLVDGDPLSTPLHCTDLDPRVSGIPPGKYIQEMANIGEPRHQGTVGTGCQYCDKWVWANGDENQGRANWMQKKNTGGVAMNDHQLWGFNQVHVDLKHQRDQQAVEDSNFPATEDWKQCRLRTPPEECGEKTLDNNTWYDSCPIYCINKHRERDRYDYPGGNWIGLSENYLEKRTITQDSDGSIKKLTKEREWADVNCARSDVAPSSIWAGGEFCSPLETTAPDIRYDQLKKRSSWSSRNNLSITDMWQSGGTGGFSPRRGLHISAIPDDDFRKNKIDKYVWYPTWPKFGIVRRGLALEEDWDNNALHKYEERNGKREYWMQKKLSDSDDRGFNYAALSFGGGDPSYDFGYRHQWGESASDDPLRYGCNFRLENATGFGTPNEAPGDSGVGLGTYERCEGRGSGWGSGCKKAIDDLPCTKSTLGMHHGRGTNHPIKSTEEMHGHHGGDASCNTNVYDEYSEMKMRDPSTATHDMIRSRFSMYAPTRRFGDRNECSENGLTFDEKQACTLTSSPFLAGIAISDPVHQDALCGEDEWDNTEIEVWVPYGADGNALTLSSHPRTT